LKNFRIKLCPILDKKAFFSLLKTFDSFCPLRSTFAGNPAKGGCPRNISPDIPDLIASCVQPFDVGLGILINFDASTPDEKRLIFHELYPMFSKIDSLRCHMIQHRGVAFVFQSPHHVFKIFLGGFGTVDINGPFSRLVIVREDGVPNICGDISQFSRRLCDKRADRFAIRVLIDADPGGFPASGKIFRPSVRIRDFHVN
jgi:hypothetical protein